MTNLAWQNNPDTMPTPDQVAALVVKDWRELIVEELNNLRGGAVQKKRDTVIALTEAKLAGTAVSNVFKDNPLTCSHNTYFKKGGWHTDQNFQGVLTKCIDIAQDWKAHRALTVIQNTSEQLALITPLALERTISLLASKETNDKVVVQAANMVFNMVGMKAAIQAMTGMIPVTGTMVDGRLQVNGNGNAAGVEEEVAAHINDMTPEELDHFIANMTALAELNEIEDGEGTAVDFDDFEEADIVEGEFEDVDGGDA